MEGVTKETDNAPREKISITVKQIKLRIYKRLPASLLEKLLVLVLIYCTTGLNHGIL